MTNETTDASNDGEDDRELSSARGRLVFISHDSRDADLAEAFGKLLSSVSAGMLKSFRSSDRKGVEGIDFGVEWYPELMGKLESACDVVCLLTARSLGRPWILYEAGVAKGKLDIPVHGLALGVPLAKVSTGPFAQFHNCDDNADSLAKLVEQLVRRLPQADPDHDTVMGQVDLFKTKVSQILASQEAAGDEPEIASDDTSTAKLFEEIKVMFQDMPSRIESVAERAGSRRHGGGRRFHPRMWDELAMSSHGEREPNLGVMALMMSASIRDDLPWLYTMASELYRSSLGTDREETRRARTNLRLALRALLRSPALDMVGLQRKDAHMLLEDLLMRLETFSATLDATDEEAAVDGPSDA